MERIVDLVAVHDKRGEARTQRGRALPPQGHTRYTYSHLPRSTALPNVRCMSVVSTSSPSTYEQQHVEAYGQKD